ncbi:MAG: hypothetical protein M1817_005405 [Caeruleum heppii]|nr:MAG: hypothetical protein M1817_005405 [Caeruleum heppii]
MASCNHLLALLYFLLYSSVAYSIALPSSSGALALSNSSLFFHREPLLLPSERQRLHSTIRTAPLEDLPINDNLLGDGLVERRDGHRLFFDYSNLAVNLTNDTFLYGLDIDAEAMRSLLRQAAMEKIGFDAGGTIGSKSLSVERDGWKLVLVSLEPTIRFTWRHFRSAASILLRATDGLPAQTQSFVGRVEKADGRVIGAVGMIPTEMIRLSTATGPSQPLLVVTPDGGELKRRFLVTRHQFLHVQQLAFSSFRGAPALAKPVVEEMLRMLVNLAALEDFAERFVDALDTDTHIVHAIPMRMRITTLPGCQISGEVMRAVLLELMNWILRDSSFESLPDSNNPSVRQYQGSVFWQGLAVARWHFGQ